MSQRLKKSECHEKRRLSIKVTYRPIRYMECQDMAVTYCVLGLQFSFAGRLQTCPPSALSPYEQ